MLSGLGFREDCTNFKQLVILTLPSLCILENLLYIIKNGHLLAIHKDKISLPTRFGGNLVPVTGNMSEWPDPLNNNVF